MLTRCMDLRLMDLDGLRFKIAAFVTLASVWLLQLRKELLAIPAAASRHNNLWWDNNMCRREKYDGWPFISFGTEDVRFSTARRDLIRPAGGSSMDQFEATIAPRDEASSYNYYVATRLTLQHIGLTSCCCCWCLLLLDKAIVIPHCTWHSRRTGWLL